MMSHEYHPQDSRLTILQWSAEDRPREKYAARGASALSNAELIAILLRTGTAHESAVDVAKRLLASCDNQLNVLAERKLSQMMETNGIGQAKATTLLAAFELCKRMRSERITQARHIYRTSDVVELMQDKIALLKHEEFWVIFLNQASKILKIEQVGRGGISNTAVDIRLIIQEAVMLEATHMIVCHNHPSGSVRPSLQDKTLTRQIRDAANIFNLHLTDHIILHKDAYFSFAEEGML